jgi:hypothetical protein
MAADAPAQGRAPKTLGHLRITIRHFLGRDVQGVVVAGSTGRVAVALVCKSAKIGRREGLGAISHRKLASAILSGRLLRIWPPPLRWVGEMRAAVVLRRGLHASPKTAQDSLRAETRQRLSEAVCRAFGGQASVCARRRPDPHSIVGGAATAFSQLLHVELEQSGGPPAGGAAHEVLGT